jgi:hypothetical protein
MMFRELRHRSRVIVVRHNSVVRKAKNLHYRAKLKEFSGAL